MSGFFVHPQGICETAEVGEGTRIWAFAHVLPGSRIGRNCNICDGVFVEDEVTIGDDVTVKCGVQLWSGVRLGNRVFVGPNATFTNDKLPRSKQRPQAYARTIVGDGASIGANATILPGIRIGVGAIIGAGAVVTRDVPARAVVVGNPGRVTGYAGAVELDDASPNSLPQDYGPSLLRLDTHAETRGRLSVADEGVIPFAPKRFFLVDKVPVGEARGSHAHYVNQQFIVAVSGQVVVALDDGQRAYSVRLSHPGIGVYLPPLVWSMQFGHSIDAVLLVFAPGPYDKSKYISDYPEFCSIVSRAGGG
jgi:UDP-2-acetamido-3-amino-2,3-dideoxy-glucuronate N-acetyltransferase